MIFNYVQTPMDRSYFEHAERNIGGPLPDPYFSMKDIGSSTFEPSPDRNLLVGAKGVIRQGVGKMELATSMGGPTNPVGTSSYGKEARQALRELRKVSDVEFTSVHVPTQINGLSGYNPQSGRFDDMVRKMGMEEIDAATKFAAEVTGGGAIVVHQSEFERPVSEANWASEKLPDGTTRYQFMSSMEEPNRTVMRVVDDRDGSVKGVAYKNRKAIRPKWKRADSDYFWKDPDNPANTVEIKKGDYIDIDGGPAEDFLKRVPIYDEKAGSFQTEEMGWEELKQETSRHNQKHPDDQVTPEVMFIRINTENQIAQQRGLALYYSQNYDKQLKDRNKVKAELEKWKKLESEVNPTELESLKRRVGQQNDLIPPDDPRLPSEILREQLESYDKQLKHTHESSTSYLANAKQAEEDMRHFVSIESYALKQTKRTLAEAGMSAFEQTKNNPHTERDIFISVENWDPNMYGSHPDEMLNMIKLGRQEMIKYLTQKKIETPGNGPMENPYYRPGISESEAKKIAENHIKMTLDTEHLALWRKKFVPLPGESREETNKRFEKWFLNSAEKLAKEGVIGHVHLVDGIEGSHTHLPMGQGEYPLREFLGRLKKAGFKGTIISEGHSENMRFGADRQTTSAWRAMGANIYGSSAPMSPIPWAGVQDFYLGRSAPPLYIFGAYSPSNEWTLWSQVPME
jgi:hypothetical protein